MVFTSPTCIEKPMFGDSRLVSERSIEISDRIAYTIGDANEKEGRNLTHDLYAWLMRCQSPLVETRLVMGGCRNFSPPPPPTHTSLKSLNYRQMARILWLFTYMMAISPLVEECVNITEPLLNRTNIWARRSLGHILYSASDASV